MKSGPDDDASVPVPGSESPRAVRERAFLFACRVVRLNRHLDRSVAGRHLADQVLRSGTSVRSNLEEAHAAQSKRDFVAKVSISLKEARETLHWLRLIHACRLLPSDRLLPLLREANELVAILSAIRKRSRATRDRSDDRNR
jgi:four helix bundle protein